MLIPSRNPGWGKNEVQLASLPIGGRFRSVSPYRTITGLVEDIYAGCVLVQLDGGPARVGFHTADGDDVEFNSKRSRRTYWAHEAPVEYVGIDPNYETKTGAGSGSGSGVGADINSDTSESQSQLQRSLEQKEVAMPRGIKGSGPKKVAKSTAKAQSTTAAKSATQPAARTSRRKTAPVPDVSNGPAPAAAPTPTPVPVALIATAPTTPKIVALFARWKMAVEKLGQLLRIDGPVDQARSQRDRIRAIYDEAVLSRVVLPTSIIQFADPVFADMELGNAPDGGTSAGATGGMDGAGDNGGAVGIAPTPEEQPEAQGGANANSDSEFQLTQENDDMPKRQAKVKTSRAKSAAGAASAARTKKPKSLHPCLCGCDAQVTGNFKQGHDARYRGAIMRVEREEMKESELPAIMRKSGGKDGEPLKFKQVANGIRCVNSRLSH